MNNDASEKVFENENVDTPVAEPQEAPAFTEAPTLDDAPMLEFDSNTQPQQGYYDPNAQQYAQPQQGYYDPNAQQYAQPQQGYYAPQPPQPYYNSAADKKDDEFGSARRRRNEEMIERGNSRATKALVWGIIAFVTFGYTTILSWIFAGIAISNARQSKSLLNDAGCPTSGKARVGYILAQIVNVCYTAAVIIVVVAIIFMLVAGGAAMSY